MTEQQMSPQEIPFDPGNPWALAKIPHRLHCFQLDQKQAGVTLRVGSTTLTAILTTEELGAIVDAMQSVHKQMKTGLILPGTVLFGPNGQAQ